jgi:hypothetical protein
MGCIDQPRHPLTEFSLDSLQRDRRVFDNVMQQCRGDRFGVELHARQNGRHGDGVHCVGLARLPQLRFVRLGCKLCGPFYEFDVRRGSRLANRLQERIERSANFCRQGVLCRWGRRPEVRDGKNRRIGGRSFNCKRASG